MDLLHKLTNLIDRDRGKFFGLLLALLISGCIVGCQPKTLSIDGSGRTVTQTEFTREVATAQAQLEAQAKTLESNATEGQADLNRQAQLRADIINGLGTVATAAATGTLNPAAGVGSIVSIALLGVAGGAALDSRRKDKVITNMKS